MSNNKAKIMFGQGYGRRRGRCRGRRWVEHLPPITYFRPYGVIDSHSVYLTVEELEALRLVDLENLTQEEAAIRMGISRKTLWNDLQRARKKVVGALINGYGIHIMGGNWAIPSSSTSANSPSTLIEDRKVREILRLLPQRNCGACGYSTCIDYARNLVAGSAPLDGCRIVDVKDKIKEILERR